MVDLLPCKSSDPPSSKFGTDNRQCTTKWGQGRNLSRDVPPLPRDTAPGHLDSCTPGRTWSRPDTEKCSRIFISILHFALHILRIFGNPHLGIDHVVKVLPTLSPWQSAQFSVIVVTSKSVISTSMDVEGGEIKTKVTLIF